MQRCYGLERSRGLPRHCREGSRPVNGPSRRERCVCLSVSLSLPLSLCLSRRRTLLGCDSDTGAAADGGA
jgi:hypothetical protein